MWRICAPRYAETAYSGEGARIHGGRWNSKGWTVVYSSESISLAVLEQLVHVEDPTVLGAFMVVSATVDEGSVETVEVSSLPDDWRAYPAPSALQEIGDKWISEIRSLGLRVPSVTVKGQWNYLLNPAHPSFVSVEVSEPEPLNLDPRITGL